MKNKIFIEKINTQNISTSTLLEMAKVQKDMWAFWLWEYVRCNCCNKIHSKKDIFWCLSSEIRRQSVDKLEWIFLWDSIKCKECYSTNTEFIHDIDKSISVFRERYKMESFLVLSYSLDWNIIWFCDWFIGKFMEIYKSELISHYWNIEPWFLEEKIKEKLVISDLDKMINFSSMWTYEDFSNLNYIYDLLRWFFNSINIWKNIPWITELDKKNSLYKIYQIIWSISLSIDKTYVNNTYYWYDSDICVFPWTIIKYFNDNYDVPLKELLRRKK